MRLTQNAHYDKYQSTLKKGSAEPQSLLTLNLIL